MRLRGKSPRVNIWLIVRLQSESSSFFSGARGMANVWYRPSELVLSEEGKELQERLWEQTMKKLEIIQPGISGVI